MTENLKRVDLLSRAEIEELYARPLFNDDERRCYFVLSPEETTLMKAYAKDRTRLYFILQLGYFKAKQQFYSFDFEEIISDIEFINKAYFDKKITVTGKITREYFKLQKEVILQRFK